MKTVFLLLIIYQVKHFLADYPLQGKYMLGKFKGGTAWIMPLLAHVGVHAAFTFVIAFGFTLYHYTQTYQGILHNAPLVAMGEICWFSLGLSMLDAAIHFVMDRIKASPDLLGRFQAISKGEYHNHVRDVEHLKMMMDPNEPYRLPNAEGMKQFQHRLVDCEATFAVKMRSNVLFWWSLGLDQMVHHLTHYLLIYLILVNT